MSQISTQHLDRLPDVDRLKLLMQSLAVLDAIMSPEWDSRYYSFNSKWARAEQLGSMRNGCGDDFFALFNRAGCFIKGFAHESVMSPYRVQPPQPWPGILDGVPDDFASCLKQPAFSMDEITFCIWRRHSDIAWSRGPIEFPKTDTTDGSAYLLAILNGDPTLYLQFAYDYYEATIPIDAVRHIYSHTPLTDTVVTSLNPDITTADLVDDLKEIGYPIQKAR